MQFNSSTTHFWRPPSIIRPCNSRVAEIWAQPSKSVEEGALVRAHRFPSLEARLLLTSGSLESLRGSNQLARRQFDQAIRYGHEHADDVPEMLGYYRRGLLFTSFGLRGRPP